MKKLLILSVLCFLFILALPSPALAHNPGLMASMLYGLYGFFFVLLILLIVSFFLLLFDVFGKKYTAPIILITNGIFFIFNLLKGFGIPEFLLLKDHQFSNSLYFAKLIMYGSVILSTISLLNIIFATFRLKVSKKTKRIIFIIQAVLIVMGIYIIYNYDEWKYFLQFFFEQFP